MKVTSEQILEDVKKNGWKLCPRCYGSYKVFPDEYNSCDRCGCKVQCQKLSEVE
jgi:rRNA maturation endonuclease Nob1